MDDNTAQNQESQELNKLEEELKSIGTQTAQDISSTATTPISQPVPTVEPIQPPPQTPPNEEVPPPSESKGSKIMMIAVGLLVLSFVGVGAYLFGAKNTVQKACTLEAKICPDGSSVGRSGPSCEFAPCPVATEDPSATWETYTANDFTFKYPPNFEKKGAVSGPINGNPRAVVGFADPLTMTEGDAPFDGFSVYIASLGGKSFEDYINKEMADLDARDAQIYNNKDKSKILKIEKGGYTWTTLTGAAFPEVTVYYLANPDGLNVVALGRVKKTDAFLETFDQILSTFKFIETAPSMTPTSTSSASPQL